MVLKGPKRVGVNYVTLFQLLQAGGGGVRDGWLRDSLCEPKVSLIVMMCNILVGCVTVSIRLSQ